uniref:Uncharacterized protein n=1 Tax=Caenorhabditis japonica TaxID=281687 RepID=A0A8R1EL44_CAEJA
MRNSLFDCSEFSAFYTEYTTKNYICVLNSSIVAMPTLSSSPFLSLRRPHAEAVLFPFTTSTFTAPVNYTVADRGRGDSLFV